MKPEEQAAHDWLAQKCPNMDLRFEPDGNVPPDFSIDGPIAIEVRRLNETRIDPGNGRAVGLNEDVNITWRFLGLAERDIPDPKPAENQVDPVHPFFVPRTEKGV